MAGLLGRRAAGTAARDDAARLATLVRALPPEAWGALPAWAEADGLGPAARDALGALAPAPIVVALDDLADRTMARGRRMAADRARIDAALRAAGIQHRWLKGAWSADVAWSPAEARPMADLDLHAPPEHAAASEATLLALGYRLAARTWKHAVFVRPDNRAVVDWRGEHPDNPRPVELHATLGEAVRGIAWPGLATEAPGDAAVLAHLLAHASVDVVERRVRLATLVDVARLMALLEPDAWRLALGAMAEPRAARLAWPALAVARRDLGAPLPPGGRAIESAAPPRLRRWLDDNALAVLAPLGGEPPSHRLLELARIWPMDARERRAIWRHALTPGRWQLADRYPRLAASPAWPLVYVRHAAYALARGADRARRRVTSGWRRSPGHPGPWG